MAPKRLPCNNQDAHQLALPCAHEHKTVGAHAFAGTLEDNVASLNILHWAVLWKILFSGKASDLHGR